MLLQFTTQRQFIVPRKDIIAIVKGDKKSKGDSYSIRNRDVVDMTAEKAKGFLARYPNECETWGADAMKKQPVIKGRNARTPQGNGQDIA